MKKNNSFLLLSMLVLFPCAFCYHSQENVLYHCWWRNATATDSVPIRCEGISIHWMKAPPSTIGLNEQFNVSYELHVEDEFYTKMFGFDFDNYRQNVNTSSPENLRHFCNNSACPDHLFDDSDQFPLHCCIWHANVHVCHPILTCSSEKGEYCGPWISDDLILSTHTGAKYGNINDVFTAEMNIQVAGTNFVIAHIQIGDLQLAVQAIVSVGYCGDGKCSNSETCTTCEADCCTSNSFPIYVAYMISAICLLFILFPVIFIVCLCYRRRKLFYDESWIIDSSKIKQYHSVGAASHNIKDGINSLASIHTILLNNKSIDSESFNGGRVQSACNFSRVSFGSQGQVKHYFTQTGVYEGRTVALKKLPRKQIILSNRIRFEVMKVRALDHPNLCRFIGATILNPVIISEYCPKGSLSDVLQNKDIPLNWGFRLSFATDVSRGMGYLHSKKMYHERLSSNNCVIDDRWTLKISDFGLSSIRRSGTLSAQRSTVSVLTTVIYQAPEVRSPAGIVLPTPAADVYSFSIILYEIATRINPVDDDLFVDPQGRPKIPLLNKEECPCPSEYVELMKQCWDLTPSNRPSFDHIKKSLHKMNPNKESPVDMMMIMMEKYSNHLEQLVAERTQELIIEQRKTSNLLYSMLPQQVADELRHGRPAAAQSFKSSTIYFSDIVGFTSLAGGSTPMEVVNMLNELYSLFDDVLDTFDVYKVETIGDAYMVVSGVPQENCNKHAGEIAKMALKLVGVTEAFKIPHRPNTKLKIRVGIHSGPVCAGVVGLKMPRYCLFGDTVNTASRMESTSEAMKIQCSDETYKLLKLTDSFTLECRGEVEIKGKGSMTTWWITGLKQTMDKPCNLVTAHPIKLSPITHRQPRSVSSLSGSSSDIMGGGASPNLSLGLKHPFSCSPLPTAIVSPNRSRRTELLPISVTDFSNGEISNKTTTLNIETLSESDTTSLVL